MASPILIRASLPFSPALSLPPLSTIGLPVAEGETSSPPPTSVRIQEAVAEGRLQQLWLGLCQSSSTRNSDGFSGGGPWQMPVMALDSDTRWVTSIAVTMWRYD
jgi:hypothetical protein